MLGLAAISETPVSGESGAFVDLAGDLALAAILAADITAQADLAGNLVPVVSFAADLTVATGAPGNYVDFTGNIGGISHYGRLAYGRGHYSRIDAFAPSFAGDIDIVGSDYFDGDLRPVITFTGALSVQIGLGAGDLAPVVTFGADLTFELLFDGGIVPRIDFGVADLGLDVALGALDGSFGFTVVFAASELISEPLWEGSELCPPPLWAESEPCPPPVWALSEPCPPPLWTTITPPLSVWTPTKLHDPVEWEDSGLCNG